MSISRVQFRSIKSDGKIDVNFTSPQRGGGMTVSVPYFTVGGTPSLGLLEKGQIYLAKKEDKKDEEKPEEKPKDPPKAADSKPAPAQPTPQKAAQGQTSGEAQLQYQRPDQPHLIPDFPQFNLDILGKPTIGDKLKMDPKVVQSAIDQASKTGAKSALIGLVACAAGGAGAAGACAATGAATGIVEGTIEGIIKAKKKQGIPDLRDSWGMSVQELTGKSIGQLSSDELIVLRNSPMLTPTEAEMVSRAYFDRKSEGK